MWSLAPLSCSDVGEMKASIEHVANFLSKVRIVDRPVWDLLDVTEHTVSATVDNDCRAPRAT